MPAPPLPKSAKKPPSFKTKIEAWMIPVAATALREGLPLALVGGLIGATKRTIWSWRDLGAQEGCTDPLLVEFALELEKARAEASQEGIMNMKNMALVDWKAQLALLQAQDPDTWSPRSNLKVEATVAPAKQRDLSKLSMEQLKQLNEIENLMLLTDG